MFLKRAPERNLASGELCDEEAKRRLKSTRKKELKREKERQTERTKERRNKRKTPNGVFVGVKAWRAGLGHLVVANYQVKLG